MPPALGKRLLAFLLLIVALDACASSFQPAGSQQTQTPFYEYEGGTPVDIVKLELAGFVPWTENGLREKILYSSLSGPNGSPLMLSRILPDLLRGLDGTLWLISDGRMARVRNSNTADIFSLSSANLDAVASVAPMADKGLIVLGRKGTDGILARLTETGELIWRRTDLPLLRDERTYASLLVDYDGTIYLHTISPQVGQVASVSPITGTIATVVDFKKASPTKIWINHGKLFWVASSEGGRYWVSQEIETSQQHTVTVPSSLQRVLGTVRAVLPDGGALLGLPETGEIIWLGADGTEEKRLALAGLARSDGGLVLGTREGNTLTLVRWQDGQATGAFQVGPFSTPPRFIYAEQNAYYLLDAEKLMAVDATGKQMTAVSPLNIGERRLRKESFISVTQVVAESKGSLLLVGADPEGAFIVRIVVRNPEE